MSKAYNAAVPEEGWLFGVPLCTNTTVSWLRTRQARTRNEMKQEMYRSLQATFSQSFARAFRSDLGGHVQPKMTGPEGLKR